MLALAQQSNILDFPTVAPQGKSNEWYTPARYIEAAREVMGSIDLDPASCKEANQIVKADRYYTKEDNGLIRPLYGKVWCNPPYTAPDGRNPMNPWTQRIIEEYHKGNIEQVIMFIMGGTYNKWFERLWEFLICFIDHKVQFHRPNMPNECLRDTTVFVYLGPNEQKFIEVFSQFGTIAKRVSQPRHTIATPSLWEVAQ